MALDSNVFNGPFGFTLTSAAIIAALGFTPAASSNVGALADGSVAAPSLSYASHLTTGLYFGGTTATSDIFGIATNGLQALRVYNQTVLSTNDGTVLAVGRSQSFSTAGAEAYPFTLGGANHTISNDSAVIGINMGLFQLTLSGGGTFQYLSANVEMDKMIIVASGATTMNKAAQTRFRVPVASTNVTLGAGYGFTFTPPNASEVTGTMTYGAMAHFPTVAAPAVQPTNGWAGAIFDAGYSAHLETVSGVSLLLNAPTSSFVNLMNNRVTVFQAGAAGAAGDFYTATHSSNVPILMPAGTTTNIRGLVSSKGTGDFSLMTNTGAIESFRAAYVASAVNYPVVSPSATGTAVTYGVAGSDTNIATNYVSKGSGSQNFYSDGGSAQMVQMLRVANAVNRIILRPGISGGTVYIYPAGETNIPLTIQTAGTGAMYFNPGGSTTLDYGGSVGGQWTATTLFQALSFKTGAPSGGTAGVWKMGVRVAATVALDTTQYVQLDIGGTLYKLAIAV
jgi:hypothetical protein